MSDIPEGPLGRVFAMADTARSNTVAGRRPNMVSKVCNTEHRIGQGHYRNIESESWRCMKLRISSMGTSTKRMRCL